MTPEQAIRAIESLARIVNEELDKDIDDRPAGRAATHGLIEWARKHNARAPLVQPDIRITVGMAETGLDRIGALLALPKDATIKDLVKAMEICVRRCEALELEVLRLKDSR